MSVSITQQLLEAKSPRDIKRVTKKLRAVDFDSDVRVSIQVGTMVSVIGDSEDGVVISDEDGKFFVIAQEDMRWLKES